MTPDDDRHDIAVKTLAIGGPISEKTLVELAEDPYESDRVLSAAIKSPSVTVAVLRAIIARKRPSARLMAEVASSPIITDEIAATILADQDDIRIGLEIRRAAADNPAMASKIIETLVADPQASVRTRAAENPSISLAKLAAAIKNESSPLVADIMRSSFDRRLKTSAAHERIALEFALQEQSQT
jgi:hypothetical protein